MKRDAYIYEIEDIRLKWQAREVLMLDALM